MKSMRQVHAQGQEIGAWAESAALGKDNSVQHLLARVALLRSRASKPSGGSEHRKSAVILLLDVKQAMTWGAIDSTSLGRDPEALHDGYAKSKPSGALHLLRKEFDRRVCAYQIEGIGSPVALSSLHELGGSDTEVPQGSTDVR